MPLQALPCICLVFCINRAGAVLAVYPHVEERRSERERRTEELPVKVEQREGERRVRVRREMERGWLVFKTDNRRRRLAPIVDGWDLFSDEELDRLCRRATPARRLGDPRPREGSTY